MAPIMYMTSLLQSLRTSNNRRAKLQRQIIPLLIKNYLVRQLVELGHILPQGLWVHHEIQPLIVVASDDMDHAIVATIDDILKL